MRGYMQLSLEERAQIYILKKARHDQPAIAAILGRHKSTISRELRRNRGLKGYRPKQAHEWAIDCGLDKAYPRIEHAVWTQIESLVRQQWSPEQIVGRLEREQGVAVSHEWIYQKGTSKNY